MKLNTSTGQVYDPGTLTKGVKRRLKMSDDGDKYVIDVPPNLLAEAAQVRHGKVRLQGGSHLAKFAAKHRRKLKNSKRLNHQAEKESLARRINSPGGYI